MSGGIVGVVGMVRDVTVMHCMLVVHWLVPGPGTVTHALPTHALCVASVVVVLEKLTQFMFVTHWSGPGPGTKVHLLNPVHSLWYIFMVVVVVDFDGV